MDWRRLISNKRLGQEERHYEHDDDRSEFRRDYDRLMFSAPFRRLQNKTQVFPLPGSVFVHNRLTHSLEVSCLGRSLGYDVAKGLIERHPELKGTLFEEISTIVSAACLGHDMGNPPFGHSGEKAIQAYFKDGEGRFLKDNVSPAFWNDMTHFEGNANAFRLLTHQYKGRRPGGFVMTYSMLASIVKYPVSSSSPSCKGKFGFFSSETGIYETIAHELGIRKFSTKGEPLFYARHPLVYLVEAADDICYEIMDIEDAFKLKILSFDETTELLMAFMTEKERQWIWQRISDENILDENERIVYMRACAIGKLEKECARTFIDHEEEILAGEFNGSLISHISENGNNAYKKCCAISKEKIYNSKPVLDVELSGYKIMETLMHDLTYAAINPQQFHSKQLIKRFSSQYDIQSDNLETRIMAVIDFISGMTDIFALDFYQKINGISLPLV